MLPTHQGMVKTHSATTRTINIATLIQLAYYCHLCIQCTFRRSSDSGVLAYGTRLGLRLSTNSLVFLVFIRSKNLSKTRTNLSVSLVWGLFSYKNASATVVLRTCRRHILVTCMLFHYRSYLCCKIYSHF